MSAFFHGVCPLKPGPFSAVIPYRPRPRSAVQVRAHATRRYTPEELKSFDNRYLTLGLAIGATDSEIEKAYQNLSKRFQSDLLKHTKLADYATDPDLVAMAKLTEAYQLLRDPGERKLYDAVLREVVEQIGALPDVQERRRRAREHIETEVGGPPRNPTARTLSDCKLLDLPPKCSPGFILQAIRAAGPTGRVMHLTIQEGRFRNVHIELASVRAAQVFGRAAHQGKFICDERRLFRIRLNAPFGQGDSGPFPTGGSRILIIQGPKMSPLMTIETLREIIGTVRGMEPVHRDFEIQETIDAETRRIGFQFRSWRRAALPAEEHFAKFHPELKVFYRIDPRAP